DKALNISDVATPHRYRLVDCLQLKNHNILHIDEFVEFPDVPFSVVSYVWRGNPADPASPSLTSFTVRGAEEADPITIDVLRHVCAASMRYGARHFWIDRLCIMQTSRDDKDWQIDQMYRIYEESAVCIVLPGGVQRLIRLDEETNWIQRGWTLQEAVAPPSVVVLFAWRLGPGNIANGYEQVSIAGAKGRIRNVVSGVSAMAPLVYLLNACIIGHTSFSALTDSCSTSTQIDVKARLFGSLSSGVVALAVAMTPSLHALDEEEDLLDSDTRNHAIWQSALLRTSSRPVDMVFSIMGLFGVHLDTRAFHQDDRLGATIALAQAILRRGGRATWLGASLRLPRSRALSTFPDFPKTSVAGKARVQTEAGLVEAGTMVEGIYPGIHPLGDLRMPTGSMDDSGSLTFTRNAIRLTPVSQEDYRRNPGVAPMAWGENAEKSPVVAMNGSIWDTVEDDEGATTSEGSLAYAVLVGWYSEYYPGGLTLALDSFQVKAMLVLEHAPGKYHVASFFEFSYKLRVWARGWKPREFCVG
ncbi:hypothetical protein OF83DRAFT_1024703, partial [Amylostereum chailletii]